MAYTKNISYITPGEPVSASVTNRPARQIAQRTDHLRGILDAIEAGQALVLREVPVEEEVRVGSPVYWNAETSRLERSYVSASARCNTGDMELDTCASCLGLISYKHSATSADLVMFGVVDLPEIRDFIPAGSGRFYLGTNPGAMTLERPPIPCVVGTILGPTDACDTRMNVYVHPGDGERVFRHVHYSHTLIKSFWKAASAFEKAPSGAVYGYSVAEDDDLRSVFPPIPIESCSFTIDWDGNMPSDAEDSVIAETFGAREIPINVENALIRVNNDGIWWMSDSLQPDMETNSPDTQPYRAFRVSIHYSRITYGNQNVYVTRLQPDTGQPFRFVNCYGEEAKSGDLYAQFTLASEKVETTDLTGTSLKQINEQWQQEIVPTIHAIRAAGNGLRFSGTDYEYGGVKYKCGLVTVKSLPYSDDYELRPQIVKLAESLESEYNGIQYLGLPYSRTSSFTMKMEVPGVFGENLKLKMRFTFLSKLAGTYPELTLSYMRLPRPKSGAVSLTGRTAFTTCGLDTNISVQTNSIFEVESDEIAVDEGDTLIFMLKRVASSAYASDAGVIRATGILNSEEIA